MIPDSQRSRLEPILRPGRLRVFAYRKNQLIGKVSVRGENISVVCGFKVGFLAVV
jgi:hypothetical protein